MYAKHQRYIEEIKEAFKSETDSKKLAALLEEFTTLEPHTSELVDLIRQLSSPEEVLDLVDERVIKYSKQYERGTSIPIALFIYNPNNFTRTRLDLLKIFLRKGANPNQYSYGKHPMKLAIDQGNLEAIKLLVEHGADLTLNTYTARMQRNLNFNEMRFKRALTPKTSVIDYVKMKSSELDENIVAYFKALETAKECAVEGDVKAGSGDTAVAYEGGAAAGGASAYICKATEQALQESTEPQGADIKVSGEEGGIAERGDLSTEPA